jgi:hypothetical protein|nr:hypothetical protein [uncultured Acetatifactor sp.]
MEVTKKPQKLSLAGRLTAWTEKSGNLSKRAWSKANHSTNSEFLN